MNCLSREEMARIPLVWMKNAVGVKVRVRDPRRIEWLLTEKAAGSVPDRDDDARWKAFSDRYQHAVLLQRVPVAPIKAQAVPMAPSERVTASDIIHEVCQRYGILKQDLISGTRQRHIAKPRQECMFRLSNEMGMSLPQIGRILGGRDHTTVLHGIRAHEATLQSKREAA